MVPLHSIKDNGALKVHRTSEATREVAEAIAVEALGFIASDPILFDRFCGVTGLSAGEMRAAASEPGFLGGVLDFVTAHEPTLMAFCERSERSPELVARAGHLIGGDVPWDDAS
ncbi:MAG: DUF3572 domain-containing protein [Fulvimarina manganoxydans]|uniref:DUF3572 domain-containing protein n=1 Tax=Fulvimarina manganoxydans TaxID=937218 RepID=UPI0023534D05|nr:DUF3572 domain-containing protein [Fulvimarina manganoxydans]MCK5931257.1 DUF3572 domain-containing protein [Fulvimarina manganoxydans]